MYSPKRLPLFSLLFFFLLSFVFVFPGCSCDPTTPTTPSETGKEKTTSDTSSDAGKTDQSPDTVTKCQVRCDCPQGQECSEGRCVVPLVPVYCCDKEGCSPGAACKDQNNVDGVCKALEKCSNTCDCKQGLDCIKGTCVAADTPVYCCDKSGCPSGQPCRQLKGGSGTCGGEGAPCTTACDCISGMSCNNGQCTKGTKLVYCCDTPDQCPNGETCQTRKGSMDVCGNVKPQCKTACDCPAGQACNNGQCRTQPVPVYCCDDKDKCPSGQVCETNGGQRQTCPDKVECKVDCDCAQGQACRAGKCVAGPAAVYCCDKPGCPANTACTKKDGSQGTCASPGCTSNGECGKPSCRQQGTQCTSTVPTCTAGVCGSSVKTVEGICDPSTGACKAAPPECKGPCDCPQGQACSNGKCDKNSKGTFCCDQAGCPSGQTCFKKDGSQGTCPKVGCQADSDCGTPSCQQLGADCGFVLPTCDKASGKCVPTSKVTKNAKCTTSASGQPQCVPNTPPQCKNHCDCPQGQACTNGKCLNTGNPVYCCSKSGCPASAVCFKSDGSKGTCPLPAQCRTTADCGGTSCKQNGNACEYTTVYCDVRTRQCVKRNYSYNNYVCNALTNRCAPKPQCTTACDCAQGQSCLNGRCYGFGARTYCCSLPGCPQGNACQQKDGSIGSCPATPPTCKVDSDCGKGSCRTVQSYVCEESAPKCVNGSCSVTTKQVAGYCRSGSTTCTPIPTCKVDCDCPQGQECAQVTAGVRTCRFSVNRKYCCDKAGCPGGQACTSKSGASGTCPIPCKTACDCPSGQACSSGYCKKTTTPVYCCDNAQQCPAGAACQAKDGKTATCGSTPRKCNSPCDCVQGEDCVSNVCKKTATPVYCCSKAGCPSGKACKDAVGLAGTCPQSCKETCDCPQGQRCLNGVCRKDAGTVYCCDKAGCPSNNFCYKKGGGTGRCPVQKCTSPCDCAQGQDCRNGSCVRVSPAVYCCSKTGCPTGQACKDSKNVWGKCGGTTPQCKSPCDCPQGQDCFRGTCVRVSPAVYCCTKTGCPAGQSCYDSSNKAGTCPGTQCTSSCDCPRQGQSCVRGRCTYISPPVYCCSKTGCPAGRTCEDTKGNLNVCGGKTCKTACDCNQGQDCRGGTCVAVSPPVYCCSKSGCRNGQPCVTSSGSSSTCKPECKVRCDCPQGQDCFSGNCFPRAGAYCCDKAGCPTGQSCQTKTGSNSTCKSTTP